MAQKKVLNPCKKCGSNAQKYYICLTVYLSEYDTDIYRCSNKKCEWHWDYKNGIFEGEKPPKVKDKNGHSRALWLYVEDFCDHVDDYDEDSELMPEKIWNKHHPIKKVKAERVNVSQDQIVADPIEQLEV